MVQNIAVLAVPNFNAMATFAFLDPFRAANYLSNETLYRWRLFALGDGLVPASNGIGIASEPLAALKDWKADMGVVSASWTPERFYREEAVIGPIRRWGRLGIPICGLDTGGFLIAQAGLIGSGRATAHYEHIDAFQEVFPDAACTEDLYVADGRVLTCGGGVAAVDLALHLIRARYGDALANGAARYVLHDRIRAPGERQHASNTVPVGVTTPDALRRAIQLMEAHLEERLSVPEIADAVGLSHRQLSRLFAHHTQLSIAQYYRNIRLDRGRSLVTQTEMSILDIAIACGFDSAAYFSRAYKARFGISPRPDRIAGRTPFEYRAWPMPPVRPKSSN